MFSAFSDFPVVHYHDQVAIPYGEEAVCDDNTGPILHNTLYGLFRSGSHA